jgi:hypothetical protein
MTKEVEDDRRKRTSAQRPKRLCNLETICPEAFGRSMGTILVAYVTTLGKYTEGQFVGETLKFPTTTAVWTVCGMRRFSLRTLIVIYWGNMSI